MIVKPVELLSVVALLADIPGENLTRGQVGTVVERLAADVYEVEFIDPTGRAYALLPVPSNNFLPERVEDLEDARDLDAAIRRNSDAPLAPWEQVKSDLGID